jgi:hypothetical protein
LFSFLPSPLKIADARANLILISLYLHFVFILRAKGPLHNSLGRSPRNASPANPRAEGPTQSRHEFRLTGVTFGADKPAHSRAENPLHQNQFNFFRTQVQT